MTICTKASIKAYREGWEKTFGREEEKALRKLAALHDEGLRAIETFGRNAAKVLNQTARTELRKRAQAWR